MRRAHSGSKGVPARYSEANGSRATTRYAGGAVLSDLDGQRRKLEASRDKLHQADENIGMAMQVMRRMKNRRRTGHISKHDQHIKKSRPSPGGSRLDRN